MHRSTYLIYSSIIEVCHLFIDYSIASEEFSILRSYFSYCNIAFHYFNQILLFGLQSF